MCDVIENMSTAEKRSYFEELVDEHRKFFRMYACKKCDDKEEAMEILQISLFKAWKNLESFEHGTNFKAWIRTIIYNSFINKKRKEQRDRERRNIYGREQKYHREMQEMKGPEHLSQCREGIGGVVGEKLDEMSDKFRDCLVLREVYDLSYQEIADKQGCALGTVMSRLYRARREFASRVREDCDPKDLLSKQPNLQDNPCTRGEYRMHDEQFDISV